MKNILAVFLLLFSISATANDWTTSDTQREAMYLTLHAIDWAQTRNIARNPDRWGETNAILGNNPSVDRVDAYFTAMALMHYAIAVSLPTEYRAIFQYVTIGVEAGYVRHNLQFGVGIGF